MKQPFRPLRRKDAHNAHVSKLNFICSMFCTQYQSDAKFYIDQAHHSGLRHLVVVYDGRPDFLAGIPDDWTDEMVLDLILWPVKDPSAPYPAWEVPVRVFGSAILFEFWKDGAPPD
jgi:hypothetical protein